jgi:hypothetical protein
MGATMQRLIDASESSFRASAPRGSQVLRAAGFGVDRCANDAVRFNRIDERCPSNRPEACEAWHFVRG